MSETTLAALSSLEFLPYLTEAGVIAEDWQGQVGVYAIFDRDRVLQFIGYSRDIALSLQQHLVRRPAHCYWLKVQTIDRPNRTILESTRDAWIAENGSVPAGNGADQAGWNQAIDAKTTMTDEEQAAYANTDEIGQIKLLKQVSRRVEEQVLAALRDRGVQMPIRFNPKLKESGLLDLK